MNEYGVLTEQEEITKMEPEYYISPKEEGVFEFDLEFRTWHPYGKKALVCYGYDCNNRRCIKLFAWRKVINGGIVFAPKKSNVDMAKVKDCTIWKVRLVRNKKGTIQWETAELIDDYNEEGNDEEV